MGYVQAAILFVQQVPLYPFLLNVVYIRSKYLILAIDFSCQNLPEDDTISRDIVDTLYSWVHEVHLPFFFLLNQCWGGFTPSYSPSPGTLSPCFLLPSTIVAQAF